MSDSLTLLEPDDRGRVSLARLPGVNAERYMARRLEDGTVILEPVVVLPARSLDSLAEALKSHRARTSGKAGTTPLAEVLAQKTPTR